MVSLARKRVLCSIAHACSVAPCEEAGGSATPPAKSLLLAALAIVVPFRSHKPAGPSGQLSQGICLNQYLAAMNQSIRSCVFVAPDQLSIQVCYHPSAEPRPLDDQILSLSLFMIKSSRSCRVCSVAPPDHVAFTAPHRLLRKRRILP